MLPYKFKRIKDESGQAFFQKQMTRSGLAKAECDFLRHSHVYGVFKQDQLIGGFVNSSSPKRIMSVLSESALKKTTATLNDLDIDMNSIQELSSLWVEREANFFARFLVLALSVFVVLKSRTYIAIMCKKNGLLSMYENGRPYIVYREGPGEKVERVYLFTPLTISLALARYPGLKFQRWVRKALTARPTVAADLGITG